ncbi:MAG: 2-C-methyl-D-erythritol 2,4-cyclodiphosphate synthase [Pseudomonadota bacterium]
MTKNSEKQASTILTDEKLHFSLLIAAAGTGERLKGDTPKQYRKIGRKTVLEHTLEKFLIFPWIKAIGVLVHPDHEELAKEALKKHPDFEIIIGSNSRKNSIYNGLNNFLKVKNNPYILIHDAARPLISDIDVHNLAVQTVEHDAATLVAPIGDSLVKKSGDSLNRDDIHAVQTPQGFKLELITEAHEQFKDRDDFTDDASIVRELGHDVALLEAAAPNIKITTQADFDMVKAMMMADNDIRTASGYDVHAFCEKTDDRPLKLGGINVKYDRALAGHSDADVVLHAVTDAIFGGMNEGDLGHHFPDTDDQWKDADSADLLKHAHKMLLDKGGDIRFIDITIICEEPKLGPYRDAMQTRIAEILDINKTRIAIKATTTEKLGFTGRGEGIACQALATLTLPEQK